MRQSVLGEPLATFEGKLKREVAYCIFAVLGLLCANGAACYFRTDENHTFMLLFNIITDIVCGSIVIYRLDTRILVKRSLLRLAKRTPRNLTATVQEISEKHHRVPGLDCVLVYTDHRVLYLPCTDTIRLEAHQTYDFQVVDNVIVEVTA